MTEKVYLTWRFVAEILIILLISVGGYFLTDVRSEVKKVSEVKLDKEQYYRECKERDRNITEIKQGIDKLIDLHIKQ